jgi:NADH dehydrogenase FAD-containing subunit
MNILIQKTRIVIIGGGFAGIVLAKKQLKKCASCPSRPAQLP